MLGAFYISNTKLITHLKINLAQRYLSPTHSTRSSTQNWVNDIPMFRFFTVVEGY
ncbi:hypothetical protein B565_1990 [Aeromonas veronii B565]|nr:hypothetical protein B565_1990 [Aeromonas veronii B565]